MSKLYFVILLITLFTSCKSNISKEELLIIDNISLGGSYLNFAKEMDSLSILHNNFCTKNTLTDINEINDNNNLIKMYYTNTFNLNNYKSPYTDHFTLLWPHTSIGSQNIIGMVLILGHTASPWDPVIGSRYEKFDISERYFSQNVNIKLIEEIKNLYISKFGQPTDTATSAYHQLYVIKDNQILMGTDPDRSGLNLRWQTKYFDINFFTGLPSYNSIYNVKDKYYLDIIKWAGPELKNKSNLIERPDASKNEIQAFSYPYILYKLNLNTIKELKLNKMNL
jgi:hypothetical protein